MLSRQTRNKPISDLATVSNISSKKCLTEMSEKTISKEKLSKKSECQITPRIARRMKEIRQISYSTAEKCAICLSFTQDQFGKLQCGHQFCLPCLIRWWRHHPTCPCCREEIMFIGCKERIIYFSDLPPEEIDQNQPFIAHCQLCWGEIESHQPMNICTVCRAVYWHTRCLPLVRKQWYCLQCSGQNQEDNG